MVLTAWDALVTGATFDATGQVLMRPGSRFVTLPWHSNHELSIVDLISSSDEEHDLPTIPKIPSSNWIHCPRSCLLRAVRSLQMKGLALNAAFQLQFILYTPGESGAMPKPLGRSDGFCVNEQLDIAADVLDEMVATLAHMDIHVLQMHAQRSPGQYELVLDHKTIIDAVDDLVLAREAVRAVARKHKLIASFSPQANDDGDGNGNGNGSCVQLSIDKHFGTKDIAFGMCVGVSKIAQHFMGGVLRSMPWLLFLLKASVASYENMDKCVAMYQSWGVNNRYMAMCLAEDRTNFEINLLDAVSNPYIALAGILLAGELGVLDKAWLPPPTKGNPNRLEVEDRPPLLPNKLEAAMNNFMEMYYHEKHKMSVVFPDEMVYEMAAVRQNELDFIAESGLQKYNDIIFSLH